MKDGIENTKVHFNFELIEQFEAGAELLGLEVKALRLGRGSLDGARVVIRGGEAFLVGATITPDQVKNAPKSFDPERTRRLLLSRKEIDELLGAESQKGLTIVPIRWYNKKRHIKLGLAIARGKKKADKRDTIQKRDVERDMQRVLRRGSA
jgi:SsrA-binding protein